MPAPIPRLSLPVDALLPEVLASLERFPSAVVQASPGSGKTTRLPPALLSRMPPGKEVLVLEPRRLAAKLAARRVAEEMGEELGGLVGYQFRFENRTGPATRLKFLTEGMLMRRMLSDQRLDKVGAVVLDEFHERHLHGDVALAYLRHLQSTHRPDLKIVVMSATLEAATLAAYLGGAKGECPIFRIDTRLHPIEIRHLSGPPAKRLDALVRDAVTQAVCEEEGDVLVFLPGMGDIRRASEVLQELGRSRSLKILPLHGELTREEQDEAVSPSKSRKIILATNVAETSLTIEGVRIVVDGGLHRQASYSWWSGVPQLKTKPISRASAIQRAGRAGRTAPGICMRLYTLGDFSARAPYETPEIGRADLAQTVLELKRLEVRKLTEFPWFEAPPEASLEASESLLLRLSALRSDEGGTHLTEIGRRMAEIPTHPRLGRLLIEASKRGCLEEASLLAALISEGELQGLDALQALRAPGGARDERIRRAKSHLLASFSGPRGVSPKADPRALEFCVLTGFPDRVARKRVLAGGEALLGAEVEVLFSTGGSARAENSGVIRDHEVFVALEVQERQRPGQSRPQTHLECVCPIELDWLLELEGPGIQETEEITWDPQRKRVVASSRLLYDSLVLTESNSQPADFRQAARVLSKAALGIDLAQAAERPLPDLVHALAQEAGEEASIAVESVLARIQLLSIHAPELELPAVDARILVSWIERALEGRMTLAETADLDWSQELLVGLEPVARAKLDQWFPGQIELSKYRKLKIHYSLSQPPWVESRLQDFFGLKAGPSIGGGRVALTLHLLAPNHRAVQVTRDLSGFWERTYPEIRKELSRKYPRHPWPDDPGNSTPPIPKR